MPGPQFIALFTLSVFWLSSFSYGGAPSIFCDIPSPIAQLEKSKFVQLPTLARTEQVKVSANQDNSPGKTPIHWPRLAAPTLEIVWEISAVQATKPAHRLAPPLTGIVVLQI